MFLFCNIDGKSQDLGQVESGIGLGDIRQMMAFNLIWSNS